MGPLPFSFLALGVAAPAALVAVLAPPSPLLRAALLGAAAALALTRLAPLPALARALLALAALVSAGSGAPPRVPVLGPEEGLLRVRGVIARVDAPGPHGERSAALHEDSGLAFELRFEGSPPPLRVGERWSALGHLLEERPLANFDTRAEEGGPRRLRCSAATLRREAPCSAPRALAEALRAALTQRIDELFPAAQRGLAQALLLGHSRAIEPAHRDRLRSTGTAHLIAVSGAHVTLFLALPLLLMRPLRRRWRVAGLAFLVLAYTLITGGAAPVRRAAAIVIAQLACDLLDRPHRSADSLCWAAVIELGWEPAQILDLSFLLSYLAVGGLLLGLRGAPAPRRAREHLAIALRAGLGATAATLPLLHYVFGTFSPHTLWLSPLGSPLLAVSMALGYSALACGSHLLAWCAAQPLVLFDAVLIFADRLAGTPIGLGALPLLASAALASAVLAALAGARRAALAALGLALLAALGALRPWSTRGEPASFFVEVLDVGHGTCVILGEPGGRVALFDAGSRHAPRRAGRSLRERLAHHGASEIAFAAISHRDDDHRNLLGAAEGLPPIRVRIGPPGCPEVDQELHAGTLRFLLGPAVAELHAPRARIGAPPNDRSLWLEIRIQDRRLLLFGDPDWLGLAELLEDLPSGCEALLWPHHGRTVAGGRALVERARPAAIWVSDEVERDLLGVAGATPVLSTARGGALLWSISASGEVELRRAR